MLARLSRFDRLIAESEIRILEQVLLIGRVEAEGGDASKARQTLKTFEGALVEYRRARKATEELRQRIEAARQRRESGRPAAR